MSQRWEYNGKSFEVDLLDADFAARYEEAYAKLGETEKHLQKVGKQSEILRDYCTMFETFFDTIYGEGTATTLFEGKKHAGMCDLAYTAFIEAALRDLEETQKRSRSIKQRYQPRQKSVRRKS